MAFSRLRDLVQKKNEAHETLRSLRAIGALKKAWETGGMDALSLPQRTWQQLEKAVVVAALTKKTVVLAAENASVAATIAAQRQALLTFFKKCCPELEIEDVTVRYARSITHRS